MSNLKDKELFNIELLCLNKENSKLLKEVKVGNIFETNSKVFAETGIYSTDIFGPIGSSVRNEQFGYIDLGVEVMHPYFYILLCALGQKYEQVAEGKKKAIFDNKIKDIVITTNGEGNTGYTWLLSQLDKIQWDDRGSEQRSFRVALIKKYIKLGYTCNRWQVLPAGLRDYVENDNGQPSEDEVNNLYRKLLGTASMVKNTNIGDNYYLIDPIRLKLQKTLVEIWEHFKTLLDGKNKFIQGKFSKRALRYGTRNVITPAPARINELNKEEDILTINHVTVGIYQYIKAIAPVAMNRVLTLFINQIINPNSDSAYLFNPKTLEPELVTIPIKKRDEWLTMEGLNDIMNKLSQSSLRLEYVRLDKYFMVLVWDNGSNIKLFLPNERVPEELDKKYLRPLTYAEMFFISVYSVVDNYPGFFTRYPVAGFGGIVPCKIKLKSTVVARTVTLEYMGQSKVMKDYPILDKLFVESLSIHDAHLGLLGADFDGDCCIGRVYARFRKNSKHIHYLNNQNLKDNETSVVNKKAVYSKGLINLRDFPRGKLIKVEGNKEYYEVPDNVEVLTVWNGETKWVHPESYSIHKNLKMLSVKTRRGNTIECSNDHSLVSLDENLNYVRCNPKKGMSVPRLKDGVNNYASNKVKYIIRKNSKDFKLNYQEGYLIGKTIHCDDKLGLPNVWNSSSNRFKKGLLFGILGGSITNIKDIYNKTYKTTNQDLAYDIVALCNSLGIIVSVKIKVDKVEYYTLTFEKKNNLDLLPAITSERLAKLKEIVTDNIYYKRLSSRNLKRKYYLEIYEKYKDILSKDEFWNKLYKIALDKNIEWEIIDHIEPIENVTEAYDLTTPPHCTFVMQNGIVVYDTCSLTVLYTDESIKEINNFLETPSAYLTPTGDIAFSCDVDNVGLVMKYLTE